MPARWHRHLRESSQEEVLTEKTWINTAEPFLVLRRGLEAGHSSVVLVNPTSTDMRAIVVATGGWYGDEDLGVIHSTAKDKTFPVLAAASSMEIEQPYDDELVDFVIWWRIEYGEPRQTLAFGLFKHQDLDGAPDLPVLGGPGALIQRNELA